MASDDSRFEQKAADPGPYMKPQHAPAFCVDEMTAIQALDRLDPVLPLPPSRAEQRGFEDYRHVTLSVYAALVVKTSKVQEIMTATQHTSQDFIAILDLVTRTAWSPAEVGGLGN